MFSGLAITPSRPAPSNSSNQRCAVARSVVAGVAWIEGPDAGQGVDQGGAPLAEGTSRVVVVAEGKQIEGDEGRRRGLGKHPHPRIRRVNALLQRLEIQSPVGGDDDFAVDHAALGQLGLDRGDQLGKIACHRPFVAAAQLDLVAVAETDRPEAIPLGLIGRISGNRANRLREHRRHRRHDREVHSLIVLESEVWLLQKSSTSTASRCG